MAEQGYPGYLDPGTAASPYAAQEFLVQMVLGRAATATLVKVVSVTNAGELSPVGFVDVQPLVNQIDSDGKPTPHGVVYGIPYFRIQGGTDAIILDPKAGDIGMAAFASHDISSVKANKDQANPGSRRRFYMADGMYFGGLLNGTPAQYVRFTAGGISIVSPSKVTVMAPNIELDASTQCKVVSPDIELVGNTKVTGNLTITGTTLGNGVNLNTHVHTGVQTGTSNSGGPI